MLSRWITKLAALTLLLNLCSGCTLLFPKNPDTVPPPPTPTKTPHEDPGGNGEGYGVYYRIKPNYKCTNKDGVETQSYKDSIKVEEKTGNFIQTGDKCADAPLSTGKASDLEVSNGIIIYQKGIYQKAFK